MRPLVRTELLNQFYINAIRPCGGHSDLYSMSIDWVCTASCDRANQSYICLRDGTEYAISLFDRMGCDVAVVGFDTTSEACVVRQIQGEFGGELPRCWEKVLLTTAVATARFLRLPRVEVVPSWLNTWFQGTGDLQLKQQLSRRYDETPKALGFVGSLWGDSTHHILTFT